MSRERERDSGFKGKPRKATNVNFFNFLIPLPQVFTQFPKSFQAWLNRKYSIYIFR